MKKVLYVLAVCFLVLAACQKALHFPLSNSVLKADKTSITLRDSVGVMDSFNIQSNINWTIAYAPSTPNWLQISKTSGSGNSKIYLTAIKSNASDTALKAIVTISPVNDTTVRAVTISVNLGPATTKADTARNVFGGSALDQFVAAVATPGGGVISIGTSISNDGDAPGGHGQEDIWVVKTDVNAKIVWQKKYGGSDRDFGFNIIAASDGGYIIVGNVGSADGDVVGSHGSGDTWLAKLDDNGNIVWKKAFGGSSNDECTSVVKTTDGGYLLTGETLSNDGDASGNHGGNDGWVIKVDASGNKIWSKTLGGTGFDVFWSGIQTADGGYIVAGDSQSNDGNVSGNHGSDDAWVVKLDGNGAVQWQKCFGGSGGEFAVSIIAGNDGGYVFAGATGGSYDGDVSGNHGARDAWVLKMDANGNKIWQKTFGGTDNDDAYFITKTYDNGYIFAGELRSQDLDVADYKGGFGDAWMVKMDINGNQVAQKLMGGSDEEWANSVLEQSPGNYLLVGETYSGDKDIIGAHGYDDAWLMKFKL